MRKRMFAESHSISHKILFTKGKLTKFVEDKPGNTSLTPDH